jgi:hypothetical protein
MLDKNANICYSVNTYRECARDKLVDRTATCLGGKVLMLDRWGGYVFGTLIGADGCFFVSLWEFFSWRDVI